MNKIFKYLKIIFKKIILDNFFYVILRNFAWILPKYRINGCSTYNIRDLIEFKNPFSYNRNVQLDYDYLLKVIVKALQKNKKISIIRLGDGEALFLQGEYKGNIKKRHLTNKNTNELNLNEWKKNFNKNNLKTFDLNWSLRKLWLPIEGEKIKTNFIPLNIIYAFIANRELFKRLKKYKIGLIGSENKISIIKKLIEFPEYQEYLGVKKFYDYISISEIGACNNVVKEYENIVCNNNAVCDIYLVGMGISKLYLLSLIRDGLNVSVLDIGSGIDALAGIIPKDRQYFGNWTNYKIKDYNYSNIDILSQNISQKHLNRFNLKKDIILGKNKIYK